MTEITDETASALIVRAALLRATQCGADTAALLRRADAPAAVLEDSTLRLAGAQADRIWQVVMEAAGPDIGFRTGREVEVSELGPVCMLGAVSHSLMDTMRAAVRYSGVLGRQRFQLQQDERDAHLSMNVASRPFLPSDPPVGELSSTCWTRLARRVAGPEVCPTRVRFRHRRPAHASDMEAFFGCPVSFDAPEPVISFRLEDATRPSPYHDPTMAQLMTSYADSLLAQLEETQRTTDELVRYVQDAPHLSQVSAERAAEALGMSVRTLYRKLKSEGDSYQAVIDRVRHQRCLALLELGPVQPAALSARLGFAETSSFYRAFRRWTGRSFAAFRGAQGQAG